MPSLDYQIANGGNDGVVLLEYDTIYPALATGQAGMYDGVAHASSWYRFPGVTIPGGIGGVTITVAYLELYEYASHAGALTKVYGEDAANPSAPSTENDMAARVRTTAGVDWDGDPGAGGFRQSPSLVAIVQELVDSYDYSAGAAMQFFHQDDGSVASTHQEFLTYDSDPARAAKLHVEYTIAGIPTITDCAPGSVERGQTLDVVLTGTEFTGTTDVNFWTDSTHTTEDVLFTVNLITVDSPTQLTVNITIDAATVVGYHGISVVNATGEGFDDGLQLMITVGSVPPPPPPGTIKGLISYDISYRYLTIAADRAYMIQACNEQSVNVLCVKYDGSLSPWFDSDPGTIAASIAAFNAAGIDIWLSWNNANGAAGWDEQCDGLTPHEFIDDVLAYNAAYPAATISGLDFDLEPTSGSSNEEHAAFLLEVYALLAYARSYSSGGQSIASQGLTVELFVDPRWGSSSGGMSTAWAQVCTQIDIASIEHYRWGGGGFPDGIQYTISYTAAALSYVVAAGKYFIVTVSCDEASLNDEAADPYYFRYSLGYEAFEQAITDYDDWYSTHYPDNYTGAMIYADTLGFQNYHFIKTVGTWPAGLYVATDVMQIAYTTRRRVSVATTDPEKRGHRVFGVQLELRDAAGTIVHYNSVIDMLENNVTARTLNLTVPAGLASGNAAVRLTTWAISLHNDDWYDILYYTDYSGAQATLLAMTMDALEAATLRPDGITPLTGKRDDFVMLQSTGWHTGLWLDAATTTPTVTSCTPDHANPGDTVAVVIAGDDFTGATLVSFGTGITVNSFVIDSDEQITANVTVAAGATTGFRTVSVTTPGGTGEKTNAFEVQAITVVSPTITSIAPASGYQGTSLTVVITGTGFMDGGATSVILDVSFGPGVTVNSYTVDSDTQITVSITIAWDAPAFFSTLTVTATTGADSETTMFTVLGLAPPVPTEPTEKEYIPTLLAPYRWAQILGLDPRHFMQVTPTTECSDTCAAVFKEHSWQHSDGISRDDVARAIQEAEEMFAEYLGFKCLPSWEYQERIVHPIPGDPTLFNLSARSPRGYASSIRAQWGNFVEAGIKAKVLIEEDIPVTYSDVDGDGYFETATVSVVTTVTDAQELHIYYPGQEGNDAWEIRPFSKAVISGGIATLTFWREQFVIASLIEAFCPEAVPGGDDDNFLSTVDAYRVYNDPSTQCTLIWKPQATDACTDCCTETTQDACLYAQNPETSRLAYQPATWGGSSWSAATLEVSRSPDQLELYYRAGYRDMRQTYPLLQMDREMERAVAYYSLCLLRREICGCSNAEAMRNHWTEDFGDLSKTGNARNLGPNDRDCPLGTQRGAIHAWKLIRRRRLLTPVDY